MAVQVAAPPPSYANSIAASTASPASAPPARPSPGSPLPNGKAAVSPANNTSTISSKDPKAAAQAASDMRNVVRRKLTGYVGFANLPNQWHRKSVRKGFNFNVMVVGMFSSNLKVKCSKLANPHQVSLASESPPSSILSSTPPSTHPRSARARASTLFPRLFLSSQSAPTLRRTACAFA